MAEETNEITGGSHVVLKKGSVAMDVTQVRSGKAYCTWENREGELVEEVHPVSDLTIYDGTNGMAE